MRDADVRMRDVEPLGGGVGGAVSRDAGERFSLWPPGEGATVFLVAMCFLVSMSSVSNSYQLSTFS